MCGRSNCYRGTGSIILGSPQFPQSLERRQPGTGACFRLSSAGPFVLHGAPRRSSLGAYFAVDVGRCNSCNFFTSILDIGIHWTRSATEKGLSNQFENGLSVLGNNLQPC